MKQSSAHFTLGIYIRTFSCRVHSSFHDFNQEQSKNLNLESSLMPFGRKKNSCVYIKRSVQVVMKTFEKISTNRGVQICYIKTFHLHSLLNLPSFACAHTGEQGEFYRAQVSLVQEIAHIELLSKQKLCLFPFPTFNLWDIKLHTHFSFRT